MQIDARPCVLAVAGGSGSGKTTVARAILEAVGAAHIAFLEQDSYYRDIEWGEEQDPSRYNFDHPEALDNELLVDHLTALREGRDIAAPIYDYGRHRRHRDTRPVPARPVILVEGLLLLAIPEVRRHLDFKIFVDTDADVRLIRRLRRDIHQRERAFDDVLRQYEESVRPMHLEFVEPSKRWADVIIPEGGENRVALQMVVAKVEKLLGAQPLDGVTFDDDAFEERALAGRAASAG